jgi:UDP-N-acetylglucosamine:LPS N-acetylglucosamine transferase
VRLDDEKLGERLLPTLESLLDDEARWAAMREQACGLARPDAAAALAVQLRALVVGRRQGIAEV